MQRLKNLYFVTVVPQLKKYFTYKNYYEVPRLKKIIINRGFDESCQNIKILENLSDELKLISGQKPLVTKAKKAISNFKLKENMPIGMFVTLRGKKMYGFLDRLINLSLPRIRDFQGLSTKGLVGLKKNSYSLGLTEQQMFPEIVFDKIKKIEGMNICIVTSAKSTAELFILLKGLGMPFKLTANNSDFLEESENKI